MTVKQEVNELLAAMTERCMLLGQRIPAEEVAWFRRRLEELSYHVNRMFGAV